MGHIHGGVDLYCPVGTPVVAMEAGEVVAVLPGTGPHAGKPWWLNTWTILVEGNSGVFAYGGLRPAVGAGDKVRAAEHLGQILPMVRFAGSGPTSLLHLELHANGVRQAAEWLDLKQPPATLLDPTPVLLALAGQP